MSSSRRTRSDQVAAATGMDARAAGAAMTSIGTVALALSWAIGIAAASTVTPIGHGEDIDWRTSPLDLNLRGLNGERFQFRCPPGKPAAGQVIGSGPYTDGSSICAAAVHAGALRALSGGPVTIEVRPGQAHYTASLSYYIQSESYEAYWSGSFLIVSQRSRPASAGSGTSTSSTQPELPK